MPSGSATALRSSADDAVTGTGGACAVVSSVAQADSAVTVQNNPSDIALMVR